MIIRHYLFNSITNLFLATRELNRAYPNVIMNTDSELLVLTIESKKDSFDENIPELIEKRGGTLIWKKQY